ncbi:hypothetical protein TNCV_67311 [Trichonephila clavipes]|nr:hypothetical protein TNCV_67311 [Trichonephila clavipes]
MGHDRGHLKRLGGPQVEYRCSRPYRWCGVEVGRGGSGTCSGVVHVACPTAAAGSDVVQSGRPIFDDFFQHLWPYIGNNTANVVFQMVKRLWLIRIDQ